MNKNKGLTLIETLVAISILMMAVASALALVHKSLDSAVYAKDQLVAIYLAQEGMELVHNQRSKNFITGADWLTGLTPCTTGMCYIDGRFTNPAGATACPGNVCPKLRYSTTTGIYSYSTGDETTFRRDIQMSSLATDERLVTVTVTWVTGKVTKNYSVQETIFNWYE